MAKKRKKTAKKAAKKKPSGVAATSVNTDAELQAAAVVTWAAEGVLGAVEYRDFDISAVVSGFPVTIEQISTGSSTAGERNGENGWEYARRQFARRDFRDRPFLRVVGRVAEILLNHRRFKTCKITDVSTVFLAEIPDQLEVHHRQNPPRGQQLSIDTVDASAWVGKKTFAERITRLCDEDLIRPTSPLSQGAATKYVLTDEGQNMFDGWPPLTDIPGLELDGPITPESRSRRRPRRRS
jgi:hypothetical protein